MKKLCCLCFIISLSGYSQGSSSVFTSTSLVYYGLDFTYAKLIGDFGNGGGFAMRDKMFPSWNELIVKEQAKYNLGRTFKKSVIYYDLAPVTAINQKVNENNIRVQTATPLSIQELKATITAYPQGEYKTGLGLVFVVESFNKNTETAIVHICFFDIASREILLTDVVRGEPRGAGLRNYWGNAIFEILRSVEEVHYSKWKKNAMH